MLFFALGFLSLVFLNFGLLFRCCCKCMKCFPRPKLESTHEVRQHSLVCYIIYYSLTYSLTHSLTHSLTYSLTHSLTHSQEAEALIKSHRTATTVSFYLFILFILISDLLVYVGYGTLILSPHYALTLTYSLD